MLMALYNLAFSQTQGVGITTNNPQRALDINGSLRVRSLTDVNADATYDNVLLIDRDGTNTSGNIDFNTVSDFRLKMLDLSSLDDTQINTLRRYFSYPICVKGDISGRDIISFPSGYEFRIRHSTSWWLPSNKAYVRVRKTSGASVNAERKSLGGSTNTTSDSFGITSSWRDIFDINHYFSQAGKAVVIIEGTAETFEITLATKNPSITGAGTVYCLCVAQTVK